MARSLSLRLTGNSSSLVTRPALLMRTWIHYRFSGSGSNLNSINSWIVGSLYSAWRAVNQYLTIHRPELLGIFREDWGATEYWDEQPGEDLDGGYHGLMEMLILIAFLIEGIEPIEPEAELPVPPEGLAV